MFAVSLAMRGATAMVTPRAARLESGRGSALKLSRVATMRAMKKEGSDGLFMSSTSGTSRGEERLIDPRKRVSTFGNAMERREEKEERIGRKDVAVNYETMKLEIDGGDVVTAVEIKKKRLGKRPKQVEYSDEMCAFAADGTCPHIKTCKRRGESLRYTKKQLARRVPASHDTYPGKRCCYTCYCKIKYGENPYSDEMCAFAADGTCPHIKTCKERGEPLRYTKSRLTYHVPASHDTYPGKRCCHTCYLKIKYKGEISYSDEMCAFAADGTCPHIKTCKRRHEPLRYRKDDLYHHVPASHDTYPDKRCCTTCYNKILASGRICCFAADGECILANKAKAKNARLVYVQLIKLKASWSAKHAGKYCCKTCHDRLRRNGPSRSTIDLSKQKPLGSTCCCFYEDGTCVRARNCLIRNVPIRYPTRRIVPPNHPRAGEICCVSCFNKIQAEGKSCARAKEESCSFFNRRKKMNTYPVVYNKLIKLPENHETYPGEWICPACLNKMQSAKRTCAFAEDGTCIYSKHTREGEAQSIGSRVPKWHPYAEENTYCCETCYKKLTHTCAFEKDEKKCIWSRRMSPSGIPKKYLDKASIRVVPETSSKYAGQPCCPDCYRRCIQETYDHEK